MEKWAVRQIKLYADRQGALTKQEIGALLKRLMAEDLVVTLLSGPLPETVGKMEQGILYMTDCAPEAERLAAEGYPVLGCLTPDNRDASFKGVSYLAEGLEGLDATYLDRVYRRLAGLPWHILETKRCILRETTEEDVDAFYRIYEESSVTRYMEPLFPNREEEICYTREYRKNVYEFYGYGVWTVILKATGEVIGRAGLSVREGYEEPELGFVIGVPWQRQGLAWEVCSAILQHGKKELGFVTVQALTEPANEASKALLEKLGFTLQEECMEKNTNYLRYLRNP